MEELHSTERKTEAPAGSSVPPGRGLLPRELLFPHQSPEGAGGEGPAAVDSSVLCAQGIHQGWVRKPCGPRALLYRGQETDQGLQERKGRDLRGCGDPAGCTCLPALPCWVCTCVSMPPAPPLGSSFGILSFSSYCVLARDSVHFVCPSHLSFFMSMPFSLISASLPSFHILPLPNCRHPPCVGLRSPSGLCLPPPHLGQRFPSSKSWPLLPTPLGPEGGVGQGGGREGRAAWSAHPFLPFQAGRLDQGRF